MPFYSDPFFKVRVKGDRAIIKTSKPEIFQKIQSKDSEVYCNLLDTRSIDLVLRYDSKEFRRIVLSRRGQVMTNSSRWGQLHADTCSDLQNDCTVTIHAVSDLRYLSIFPYMDFDEVLCAPRQDLVGLPYNDACVPSEIHECRGAAMRRAIASGGIAVDRYQMLWGNPQLLWRFKVEAHYLPGTEEVLCKTIALRQEQNEFWKMRIKALNAMSRQTE